MKKIINLLLQSFTNATRDNFMLYVIIAPILLAFLIRAFVPTVEEAQLRFAVHDQVGVQTISQIEDFGEVQLFKTVAEVMTRVERVDFVAGITRQNDELQLMLEGNEPVGLMETYKVIIGDITSPEMPVAIGRQTVPGKESILFDALTAILLGMAMYMGAIVAGFTIVEEKETKVLSAIAVSPVKTFYYISSKGLFAFIIGLFGAISSSLILLGFDVNYLQVILAVLFSGRLTVSLSMIMGSFADNQMTALVVQKMTGWIYMIVPILTFFIKEEWQFIFYPLPTYWQILMLRNLVFEQAQAHGFWLSGVMTLLTGAVMLLIMGRIFKGKVKFR